MKHPGVTIFLVFFGVSVLDAFRGGHWPRILFWVGIGLAFWAMELGRHRKAGGGTTPAER